MRVKKSAGFFIRFLSLMIDISIFSLIAISLSLITITKVVNKTTSQEFVLHQVTNYALYYLWLVFLIVLIVTQFFLIPFLAKGRTIGMFLTKLELEPTDATSSIKQLVWKRFQFGALLWIVVVVLFMSFISPTIINKISLYSYVQKNESLVQKLNQEEQKLIASQYQLNTLETAFMTISSTASTIVIFMQLIILMSIGIGQNKLSIIDKVTNSKIVYQNKIIIQEDEKILEIISPEKISKNVIKWKN